MWGLLTGLHHRRMKFFNAIQQALIPYFSSCESFVDREKRETTIKTSPLLVEVRGIVLV